MLDGFSWNLLLATAAVAVIHTLAGPDHYLPFIMMARAGRWSKTRTAVVTTLCGLGHVASSLLLGGLGIAFGAAVADIAGWETARGNWAAWGMVAFGAAYALWGLRHAIRRKRGLVTHDHGHHAHVHVHGNHDHGHDGPSPKSVMGYWALFAIFVLGPCEPLIPQFVIEGSAGRWGLAAISAALFTVLTVGLMVGIVLVARSGLGLVSFRGMERWAHTLAGGVIAASGLSVLFLGL